MVEQQMVEQQMVAIKNQRHVDVPVRGMRYVFI